MTDFKTRYNYFVFGSMVLGFLVFVLLVFVLMIYGSVIFNLIVTKEKNKIAMYIGLSMVPIGILYAIYYWGRILKNYRSILTFTQNSLTQKDAIFSTINEYPLSEIEGYVYKSYLGSLSTKRIIIHFKDGTDIGILNSLTLNFEELILTLESRKIKRI